jgi:hypothetical protein
VYFIFYLGFIKEKQQQKCVSERDLLGNSIYKIRALRIIQREREREVLLDTLGIKILSSTLGCRFRLCPNALTLLSQSQLISTHAHH